ncbi:uncharacterized domain 1-containing protein [Luteibacter sp. UNC138MFCol5.1]|uniref:PaaI family thioesterase n=1 Tax=Luteibacter sp. UNC138MFCol5.1 TaxID=1502774 RepID=UPI0008D0FBEC|nr:PaaI family thioesterase [Luteibacter sp. UNC138MFCol5.1]SEO77369.1 uncharacterized domain 1-containing protein [Luteibacter sp. UNC138MFCol5.1]
MTTRTDQHTATGLDFLLTAKRTGGLGVGIGETLGMTLGDIEDGRVVIEASPGPEHGNPMGSVHGGYLATMLDGAMALAVQTQVDVGTRFVTTDLNITYVRPVMPRAGVVYGTGSILHRGRTLALAEARITDADGVLYAHATGTFAISAPLI